MVEVLGVGLFLKVGIYSEVDLKDLEVVNLVVIWEKSGEGKQRAKGRLGYVVGRVLGRPIWCIFQELES